jgi:cysteine desulfuration protein SufE
LDNLPSAKSKELTMTISEIQEQIASEFSLFDDWMDKYNYLIDMGKSLPVLDESYKTDQYVITGCQSRVWLHADYRDGKIFFSADSDAIITKGIVNLLIRVLSGHTPDEILNADMDFIDKVGLREHLSPTRSNGLTSMIKQMKLYALAFRTKANAGN